LLAASQWRRQRSRQRDIEEIAATKDATSTAAKGATVVRLELRKRREEGAHAVDRLAVA